MSFTLLRASAGSGKTYALVNSYLRLVLKEPDAFRHILAITFTNKAAAEMKEKIIAALKAFSAGQEPERVKQLADALPGIHIAERSRVVLNKILHHYADFAIMTIDSFMFRLIRTFSLELGLPLGFNVELHDHVLKDVIIGKLLAGIGTDKFLTDTILRFVLYKIKSGKSWQIEKDLHTFASSVIANVYPQWLESLNDKSIEDFARLIDVCESERARFCRHINRLAQDAMAAMTRAGLGIDDFAYKDRSAAAYLQRLASASDIAAMAPTSYFRNDIWTTKATPAATHATIEQLLAGDWQPILQDLRQTLERQFTAALSAATLQKTIYVMAILRYITAFIDDYKTKTGTIPIAEFNVRIHNIIAATPVPFIYSLYGEKYNHYLIDEFQDTSRLQWQNLVPLVENAIAYGHSSLAVGDGKQSIYRWRGGDTAVMSEDIPFPVDVLKLEHNYRSRPQIVAFNNHFFAYANAQYGSENDKINAIYNDVVQHALHAAGGYVQLQFVSTAGQTDETSEDSEPVNLVQLTGELLAAGYRYADIAILVRDNRTGRDVAEVLMTHDMPVISPDSLRLDKVAPIQFMLAALTVIARPDNLLAKAQMAYFLSNAQKHGPAMPMWEDFFLTGNPAQLPDDWSAFHAQRHSWLRLTLGDLAEELIRLFGLADRLQYDSCGYLQAFLDAVALFSSEHSDDIGSFLEWWQLKGEEFTLQPSESKNALRIMTIHKAKGLEFPVVIIPHADWRSRPNDRLWLEPHQFFAAAADFHIPLLIADSKDLAHTYFADAYHNELAHVTIDNLNLLYVAFTRAIERLYIFSSRRNENGKLLAAFASAHMTAAPVPERYVFGDSGTQPGHAAKAKAQVCEDLQRFISEPIWQRLSMRRNADHFWRFSDERRQSQRQWGILVHQTLAAMAVASDLPHILARFSAEGVTTAYEARTLADKVGLVLQLPQAAEWFSGQYQVLVESPIITPHDVLRPDRVLLDGLRAVVIDFKSGMPSPADTAQIKQYGQALAAMGYTPVEMHLLYLDKPAIVTIDERT